MHLGRVPQPLKQICALKLSSYKFESKSDCVLFTNLMSNMSRPMRHLMSNLKSHDDLKRDLVVHT